MAFLWLFNQPIPFLPYNGLMDDLTVLLTRPVVLALIDFIGFGVLSPNFIVLPLSCFLLSITQ